MLHSTTSYVLANTLVSQIKNDDAKSSFDYRMSHYGTRPLTWILDYHYINCTKLEQLPL